MRARPAEVFSGSVTMRRASSIAAAAGSSAEKSSFGLTTTM